MELDPLNSPGEINALIWRYMDFTKFISLLECEALFFSCIACLNDPFEGTMSARAFDELKHISDDQELEIPTRVNILDGRLQLQKFVRNNVYVNSWSVSEYESAALWNLYLSSTNGIVIQSRTERLMSCWKEEEAKSEANDILEYIAINIVKMEYSDYRKEFVGWKSALDPIKTKRISFAHENELRAVIIDYEGVDNEKQSSENLREIGIEKMEVPGYYIPVNLEKLIDNIYVAPTSDNWFYQLVCSVVKRYGLDVIPKYSDLSNDPIT